MTNATNNSEALLRTAQNPKNPRNPKNDKNQNPRVSMRRIVRLFKPYRWSLGFVLLLVAASSLVSLVNPFLIRAVIDVALPQGRTGLLTLLAAAMIVVAIANSSFSVSQTYVSTKVGQRVMHDLRTAVYSHLQRMSLGFFTKTRTGEVQSRIANDIGGMQATVTTTATALVSNATTVIAAVIAMAGDTPVSAGRVDFPAGGDFASIWGGGTLPAWRGRGIFRSLVAYRAALAHDRGYRYLHVDASPDSRPILRRLGFAELAETTPYQYPRLAPLTSAWSGPRS